MSQYDAGGFTAYHESMSEPPRTSLLAVSGFISSVIFCCPLTSLIGLLLGVGGLVSVSSSNGRRKGTGLAAAAVLIALVSMAVQVLFFQVAKPYMREAWRVMTLMTFGPVPMISDLEVGDFQSARSYLYPALDAQLSDEQLQYFADQIAERYGSVQQWLQSSAASPPSNSTVGEQTISVTNQMVFSKQTVSMTIDVKILKGTASRIDQSGFSRIVIHDEDLGDLILDANTPSAPIPPGAQGEPGGADEGGDDGGGG